MLYQGPILWNSIGLIVKAAALSFKWLYINNKGSIALGGLLDNRNTDTTCKFSTDVSALCHVWDKCSHEWSQNHIENHKIETKPYVFFRYPSNPKLHLVSFVLRLAIFELQAILSQMHRMQRMAQNDTEHYQVKGTPYTCMHD